MSFLRDGIEDVRARALPDAIAPDGPRTAFSRTALVTWRSNLQGRLFQVYVNGRRCGLTLEPQQRALVVEVPSSFESAAHVEVIAVDPEEAHVDFAEAMSPPAAGRGRVKLTLPRLQSLPAGGAVNVYLDNGERLNRDPIPLWPCEQDKAGLGLARFGLGDFGYDSAAAVGFGRGAFGQGQFGLDAETLQWTSPALPLGAHRLAVTVIDACGNESDKCWTETIAVIPGPRAASRLTVTQANAATGQLTLNISDPM